MLDDLYVCPVKTQTSLEILHLSSCCLHVETFTAWLCKCMSSEDSDQPGQLAQS